MDSFRVRLQEINKVIENDSYRRRVLVLCQQLEPKSFDEYSSSGSFRRLEKFESSTYSEVLKAVDLANNNKPVVMKIMRALSKGVIKRLPSVATRGCQSYNDILNELVVTQALSQLHDGVIVDGRPNGLYVSPSFCYIHEIKVVSGNLDRALSKSAAAAANDESRNALPIAKEDAPPTGGGGGGTSFGTNHDRHSAPQHRTVPLDEQHLLLGEESTGEGRGGQGAVAAKDSDRKRNNDNETKKDDINEKSIKMAKSRGTEDELRSLHEEDRMLMEALPHEYVVSVMRHDGQPLWWMMTHKKLTSLQLSSVLVQVIVGLAIAECVYLYEHRDLHVSNILIAKLAGPQNNISFVLDGHHYFIESHGVKATIIDATFSRLTLNGRVYCRDLTSTLRAYATKKTPTKMSLQNRSYRQMVRLTRNNWDEFTPKTNLIWLTYLCETLMKNDTIKADTKVLEEIGKIRDHTLRVSTTIDLLKYFPISKVQTAPPAAAAEAVTNRPAPNGSTSAATTAMPTSTTATAPQELGSSKSNVIQ